MDLIRDWIPGLHSHFHYVIMICYVFLWVLVMMSFLGMVFGAALI